MSIVAMLVLADVNSGWLLHPFEILLEARQIHRVTYAHIDEQGI